MKLFFVILLLKSLVLLVVLTNSFVTAENETTKDCTVATVKEEGDDDDDDDAKECQWETSQTFNSAEDMDDDDNDDDDEDDIDDIDNSLVECPDPENCEWEHLTDDNHRTLWRHGITQLMWDRFDDQEPYVTAHTWEDLLPEYQAALKVLGWDASVFFSTVVPSTSRKRWNTLTPQEQEAATVLGYQEHDWFLMSIELAESFEPIKLQLDLPELQNKFGYDYLVSLTDIEVAPSNGATIGDDMYYTDDRYSMAAYVKDAFSEKGTTRYLKYEDHDSYKKELPSEIGTTVIRELGGALKASKEMREKGHWKESYDTKTFSEYNWSFWVAPKNTSTALHYDIDELNFLWVLKGKKRVIMIPNDERTVGKYSCTLEATGASCWPGVDVLYTSSEELPEHAVEVFLGPGEGLSIPKLSWHAVQNLEPTIAYGFRTNPGFWDEPWSALSEEEKEFAINAGYTEQYWNSLVTVGRDAKAFEADEKQN